MDIIGKWKIAEVMSFGDDGIKWVTPEEYIAASDEPEEAAQTVGMLVEFTQDGKAISYIPLSKDLTQEEIDEAIAEEGLQIKDGYFFETKEWKEENGAYLYNSEIEGEILDEEVSPWVELTFEDGGKLLFMEMFKLEKM